MRFLFILLLFINLQAFAQNKSVELSINILPALKDDFDGEKIHLFQIGRQKFDTTLSSPYILRIVCDTLQQIAFLVTANIEFKKLGTYKHFDEFITATLTDSVLKLNITFPRDCSYNKNLKRKICPACNKDDQIIPIIYGLPTYDLNGDLLFKEYGEYHSGGCEISDCDPTWFCKRDNTEF